MKILVVDDEETMVRSLSTLLAEEGYEVTVAMNGAQALEAARAERPDLILLDVMLPGIDGMEGCRQIRTWSTVPIIMLTAKTGEVDKVVGLEVGADDYVTKPFSSRELVARIKANLRRAQMQAQQAQGERLAAGEVLVDGGPRRGAVRRRAGTLSPQEFDLLKVLLSHRRRELWRR